MLRAESDENTCREDNTPSEKVLIGRVLEEMEKPEANARQRENLKRGSHDPRGEKFPPREKSGKTRDIVGAALGMSGLTYQRAAIEASQRATARALGVDASTINRDLQPVASATPTPEKASNGAAPNEESVADATGAPAEPEVDGGSEDPSEEHSEDPEPENTDNPEPRAHVAANNGDNEWCTRRTATPCSTLRPGKPMPPASSRTPHGGP